MSESYKPLPEAADLWELFSYNPLTGNLHWLKSGFKKKLDGVAGSLNKGTGYWTVDFSLNGQRYRTGLSRLGWAWVTGKDPKSMQVDHADRNPLNNQFSNLRLATPSQQIVNKRPRPRVHDLPRGVEPLRGSKTFCARIAFNGKKFYLGAFATPEEAHQAYCAAAERLHGDFAA